MLVLTRRENESIFIGDNIKVILLELKRDRIKIGIEAPANVRILRDELVGKPQKRADK